MDIDKFWELNEGMPQEDAADELEARLSELTPAEIELYQRYFDEVIAKAYNWPLWGAAYIIDGGCSDDGFTDFRRGLISRGRTVFEAAIANPDSLADVVPEGGDCSIPDELFGYVARRVYKRKTGKEMPDNDVEHPAEPFGEQWDFDDAKVNAQKLPRIWAKFGD